MNWKVKKTDTYDLICSPAPTLTWKRWKSIIKIIKITILLLIWINVLLYYFKFKLVVKLIESWCFHPFKNLIIEKEKQDHIK